MMPFFAKITGAAHSASAIVSVAVLALAEASVTYRGSVPAGMDLVQPLASASTAGVVMAPTENVKVTAPGISVGALAERW